MSSNEKSSVSRSELSDHISKVKTSTDEPSQLQLTEEKSNIVQAESSIQQPPKQKQSPKLAPLILENEEPEQIPEEPSEAILLGASLQWLKDITYLEIRQQTELMEVLCCCESSNMYHIYNKQGQHIADAKEKGRSCLRFCCRNCCENRRGFTIQVKSFDHGPSFVCQRRFNPCVGCCPPCSSCVADKLRVRTMGGEEMATCMEACTIIRPRYRILDYEDVVRFTVLGPWCQFSCCCCCKDIKFTIRDRVKGGKVGRIYKKWGGFVKELVSDADTFVLEIDVDIAPHFKASLIGLTFLIDFMYFEDNSLKKRARKKD